MTDIPIMPVDTGDNFSKETLKEVLGTRPFEVVRDTDPNHGIVQRLSTFLKQMDKEDYVYVGYDLFVGLVQLLERQQAEIEKLKKDCIDIDKFARNICEERLLNGNRIATFEDLQTYIKKQKAEALKEFVEKLKESKIDVDVSFGYGREHYTEAVAVIEIENLLKERIGDE